MTSYLFFVIIALIVEIIIVGGISGEKGNFTNK